MVVFPSTRGTTMEQLRSLAVTIDCADARAAATFWSQIVGGAVNDGATEEFASLHRPGHLALSFVQVPEPKTAKSRTHLDVSVDDLESAVQRAVQLGATHHAGYDGWATLLDPDGNEFCLVAG